MWSASIFHGQVQCTICPCEILGKPPQGQLHSCGIFIKDTQTPHRHQAHPARKGSSVVVTVHPHDYTFLILRTLPLQYTPHKLAHICICITQLGLLLAWAPCGLFALSKWHPACRLSTSLSKVKSSRSVASDSLQPHGL